MSAGLKNRLEAFQICDSTFPIGSFNHSFGMENYLSDRRIRSSADFEQWLVSYFRSQFSHGEGLLVRLVYEALSEGAIERMWEYDEIITCSTLAFETRRATQLIARQMMNVLKRIHADIPLLDSYQALIAHSQLTGNPAIIFTIFAHHKALSCEESFSLYGYSVASTLVQNAVRAVPLGQGDGQVILHRIIRMLGELYDEVAKLDESYLGANVPGLELAQMAHETQPARLFMS